MTYNSSTQRILNRFAEVSAKIDYRTDIAIDDIKVHSPHAASLLLSYNPAIGEINGEQLAAYFHKTFENKVAPVLATARQHKGVPAISIVAEIVATKRPIEDSKKMLSIASAQFIDTKMDETYEVKEIRGKKFLSKVMSDNISDIVAERTKRMAVTASAPIRFEQVEAGVALIDKGDKIRYFYLGTVKLGEVTSVGKKISVKSSDGETNTIAKEAVLEMIAKSPEAIKKSKASDLAFYTKMYGDEDFAKQLVGLK